MSKSSGRYCSMNQFIVSVLREKVSPNSVRDGNSSTMSTAG